MWGTGCSEVPIVVIPKLLGMRLAGAHRSANRFPGASLWKIKREATLRFLQGLFCHVFKAHSTAKADTKQASFQDVRSCDWTLDTGPLGSAFSFVTAGRPWTQSIHVKRRCFHYHNEKSFDITLQLSTREEADCRGNFKTNKKKKKVKIYKEGIFIWTAEP